MSDRPYKVEQWSRGFNCVTKTILEAARPAEAHAEFDRVVQHRPRGWSPCAGVRRSCASTREAARPIEGLGFSESRAYLG